MKKIEREPLWDLAHVQLRDALLAGHFAPGRALPLRDLAQTFGISITPVRDAVTRLVAQGILQQGPRNSAVVPHLTVEELRHLTLVRCELEGRAAREAAARPDAAALARLDRQLATMRDLIARRQLDTYLDVHRAFHFGIYALAKIPILQEMIENLWLRCGPVLSFVVPDYVLLRKGSDHHAAALAALSRGDPSTAEAEIVADIEEASRYLVSLADGKGLLRPPSAAA
ncbi:MAG: GntR family transcriptional regulator [Rhodoplanes sp.]|nr:GntR family transcriptional regulator [Rhodoplanes sp.]